MITSRFDLSLHHHHHSRCTLAAETGTGGALAVGPGLVQEGLTINVVPVCSLHCCGAASVRIVGANLGQGHEVDGAATVKRTHESVLDGFGSSRHAGGGRCRFLGGRSEYVWFIGAVLVLLASENGTFLIDGGQMARASEVDDEENGQAHHNDGGHGNADS